MPAPVMSKKKKPPTHFQSPDLGPSRRRYRGKRLTYPIVGYGSLDEAALATFCAELVGRSRSGFVMETLMERCTEIVRTYNATVRTGASDGGRLEQIRRELTEEHARSSRARRSKKNPPPDN